jgi:hypothetical protein
MAWNVNIVKAYVNCTELLRERSFLHVHWRAQNWEAGYHVPKARAGAACHFDMELC